MPKFHLYYGVEQEEYNLHVKENVELETLDDAKAESRKLAEELYMQNPVRDIEEIIADGEDKDTAQFVFNLEMFRKTIYHVEELVELGGEVVETIRHDFK
jgi:hypothetical protein